MVLLGSFPRCRCKYEAHLYDPFINKCYVKCPADAEGYHPDCHCNKQSFIYNDETKLCESKNGEKCPNGSIGIGPDCLCLEKNYIFSEYLWKCYDTLSFPTRDAAPPPGCPESLLPKCDQSITSNVLKSLIGQVG